MDTNQTDLAIGPLCTRVILADERLTLKRMNCYLTRGRYLHSEFTVHLLAAAWQKLKLGFMRIGGLVRNAADKLHGSGGICDNDAFAQQKHGAICKKELILRS